MNREFDSMVRPDLAELEAMLAIDLTENDDFDYNENHCRFK